MVICFVKTNLDGVKVCTLRAGSAQKSRKSQWLFFSIARKLMASHIHVSISIPIEITPLADTTETKAHLAIGFLGWSCIFEPVLISDLSGTHFLADLAIGFERRDRVVVSWV